MIRAIITQMFIPPEEPIIPTLISTNETNAEFETQPVTVEERSFQHNLYAYMSSYTFHALNLYVLFHLKDNFLLQSLGENKFE